MIRFFTALTGMGVLGGTVYYYLLLWLVRGSASSAMSSLSNFASTAFMTTKLRGRLLCFLVLGAFC